MKKSKEILTIVAILIFVVGVGIFIGLRGVKSHNNHYVRIEVNPKIEFITDSHNSVLSYVPINEEAKIIVCQENFNGLNIEEASLKFIQLCAQANYINVTGNENAVRITTISGLTHSLENKVYKTINNYFKQNNIKGIVVESENDIDLISEAQDKNIASANKLMLINAIIEKDNKFTPEQLNKLNESKLIDKLIEIHNEINHTPESHTVEQLANKSKLIDLNRKHFEEHIYSINNKKRSEFSDELKKIKAEKANSYEENFNEAYNNWRNALYN